MRKSGRASGSLLILLRTGVLCLSLSAPRLDGLFLDTTYLDPRYSFPPQRDVIDFTANLAVDFLQRRPKTLVICGTYTIGKERIFKVGDFDLVLSSVFAFLILNFIFSNSSLYFPNFIPGDRQGSSFSGFCPRRQTSSSQLLGGCGFVEDVDAQLLRRSASRPSDASAQQEIARRVLEALEEQIR